MRSFEQLNLEYRVFVFKDLATTERLNSQIRAHYAKAWKEAEAELNEMLEDIEVHNG